MSSLICKSRKPLKLEREQDESVQDYLAYIFLVINIFDSSDSISILEIGRKINKLSGN